MKQKTVSPHLFVYLSLKSLSIASWTELCPEDFRCFSQASYSLVLRLRGAASQSFEILIRVHAAAPFPAAALSSHPCPLLGVSYVAVFRLLWGRRPRDWFRPFSYLQCRRHCASFWFPNTFIRGFLNYYFMEQVFGSSEITVLVIKYLHCLSKERKTGLSWKQSTSDYSILTLF